MTVFASPVTRAVILLTLIAPILSASGQTDVTKQGAKSGMPEKKSLKVLIEGDTSVIPKMIKMLREKQEEYGFDFTFVDKITDPYDIRLVLSAEGSSVWNYAHGNAVVMTPEGKVLFTVTRSNRLTGKGATSAVTKEVVKGLHRYYNTPRKI